MRMSVDINSRFVCRSQTLITITRACRTASNCCRNCSNAASIDAVVATLIKLDYLVHLPPTLVVMRLTLSAAMNVDEACTRQEAHGSSDAQTSELSGELNGVLDRVEALCMAVTIAIEIGSLDLDLCLLFVSSHHALF